MQREKAASRLLSPYGYVYLPNTHWSVPQRRPRSCLPTDKQCGVCPIFTTGVPLDALPYSRQWKLKTADNGAYNPDFYYAGYYGRRTGEASSSSTSSSSSS